MWQFRAPVPSLLCRFHIFSRPHRVKCRRLPLILRQNNFISPHFFEILPHISAILPCFFATVQHCACESARESVMTAIMRTGCVWQRSLSNAVPVPCRPRVLAKVSLWKPSLLKFLCFRGRYFQKLLYLCPVVWNLFPKKRYLQQGVAPISSLIT